MRRLLKAFLAAACALAVAAPAAAQGILIGVTKPIAGGGGAVEATFVAACGTSAPACERTNPSPFTSTANSTIPSACVADDLLIVFTGGGVANVTSLVMVASGNTFTWNEQNYTDGGTPRFNVWSRKLTSGDAGDLRVVLTGASTGQSLYALCVRGADSMSLVKDHDTNTASPVSLPTGYTPSGTTRGAILIAMNLDEAAATLSIDNGTWTERINAKPWGARGYAFTQFNYAGGAVTVSNYTAGSGQRKYAGIFELTSP